MSTPAAESMKANVKRSDSLRMHSHNRRTQFLLCCHVNTPPRSGFDTCSDENRYPDNRVEELHDFVNMQSAWFASAKCTCAPCAELFILAGKDRHSIRYLKHFVVGEN